MRLPTHAWGLVEHVEPAWDAVRGTVWHEDEETGNKRVVAHHATEARCAERDEQMGRNIFTPGAQVQAPNELRRSELL